MFRDRTLQLCSAVCHTGLDLSAVNYRSIVTNRIKSSFIAGGQLRNDSDAVGDFEFGRDSRALFSAQPENIFVVKVNYWLNH